MIIKLLEDNTVYVRYRDGRIETINSTHSHKALSKLTKAIANTFPYKGAMDFIGKEQVNFDAASALVTVGARVFTPDSDTSAESLDAQAFCDVVWNNGGRRLYEAKQKLQELENDTINTQ